MWSRLHLKPRRSLFTPYKVARGPSSAVRLDVFRFTKGVTQSGQKFEFHDKWGEKGNSHRLLEEPWVGVTTFVVKDQASLLDVQLRRAHDAASAEGDSRRPAALRWADLLEEE